MLTKGEIITQLKKLKPALRKEYLVKEIGVFGSFSNETNTEDSDIDILVDFEKPIGWRFFSLELLLEESFGRKIDLVTRNGLKPQLKHQILQQVQLI